MVLHDEITGNILVFCKSDKYLLTQSPGVLSLRAQEADILKKKSCNLENKLIQVEAQAADCRLQVQNLTMELELVWDAKISLKSTFLISETVRLGTTAH